VNIVNSDKERNISCVPLCLFCINTWDFTSDYYHAGVSDKEKVKMVVVVVVVVVIQQMRKEIGSMTSTQLLRDLEISLRTNKIQ